MAARHRLLTFFAAAAVAASLLLLGLPVPPLGHLTSANASVSTGDLVFEQHVDTAVSLVLLHRGTETTLRSSVAGGVNDSPDVSPDGSRVVFRSQEHYGWPSDIWVMNADGTNATALTHPGDGVVSCDWFDDSHPRWSPNGQKIVFVRYTQCGGGQILPNPIQDIMVMNADGTGVTDLTPNTSTSTLLQYPAWSPDGTKIAFQRSSGSSQQIWVMGSTGSSPSPHNVTPASPGNDEWFPDWSPDGGRIYIGDGLSNLAYLTSSDSFATAANSTWHDLVSGGTYRAEFPRVSADGSYVYFDDANTGKIDKADTSTTNSVSLVKDDTSFASDVAPAVVKAAWPNGSTKTLVGLGDSVAAGEGINYGFIWNGKKWVQNGPSSPSWMDTTRALGANFPGCHQSGIGYPALLSLDGGNYDVYNMACTGASALQNNGLENGGILDREILGDGTSPPAQLGGHCTSCSPLSTVFNGHHPAVVTLTLGADDINFAEWVTTCYNPFLGSCDTKTNTSTLNSQLSLEKTDLAIVFHQLNAWATAKNKILRVLVTNYYNPFNPSNTNCIDYNGPAGVGITPGELAWLEGGLNKLNANIAADATNAQSTDTNLKVSLVDLGGVMSRHKFCSAHPWVYGPSIDFNLSGALNPNPAPFHPTPDGQRAIYRAVNAHLP